MQLLEEDENFLKGRGYQYDLVADGETGCLIIKGFPLAAGKYDRDTVDLLVCIPKGYNDAQLDNFYVDPPIRLKATGEYPNKGDHFESHAGRNWQRLSRHVPNWRAGIDMLKNFLPFAEQELQHGD